MGWQRDGETGLVIPTSALPDAHRDEAMSPGDIIKANMRQFLIDTLHDRLTHAKAIADGPHAMREAFMKNLGAYFNGNRGQCDTLADLNYRCLKAAWRDKYPEMGPEAFLDAVHVPSPLSEKEQQAEIDDAWELEIAGSEDALRTNYEGSARTRKGKDLGAKRPH